MEMITFKAKKKCVCVCIEVLTVGQLKHQSVVQQVERIETFRTKLFGSLQGNDTRGRRTAILGQRQKTSIVRGRSAPSSGKAKRRTCWTLSRLAPKLKIASPLSYSRLVQTELFNRKYFAMTFFFLAGCRRPVCNRRSFGLGNSYLSQQSLDKQVCLVSTRWA